MRHRIHQSWQNLRLLSLDIRYRVIRHWKFPFLVLLTTVLGCAYVWEHTLYLEVSEEVNRARTELDLLIKQNKQTQWEVAALEQRTRIDQIAMGRYNFQVLPVEGIVYVQPPVDRTEPLPEPSLKQRILTMLESSLRPKFN